jgi:hypothetical protein
MKVLYIAGWGRSGTTILDNILGSCDAVFSVGELFYLWRRGLVQGRRCGCGAELERCGLWRAVLDVAYDGDPPRPQRTARLQRQAVRVRDTRRIARRRLSEPAADYRDEIARVYRALARVTGAGLVVDSSKVPSGAAVLGRIRDIDSYLLHMVRDPRAVAYSWMRATPQPDVAVPRQMARHRPAASTRNWLAWNVLVEDLARTAFAGRSMRLRYEDFASDPRAAVEAVLGLTGVAAAGLPFTDGTTVRLRANHTVSGNPSRFVTGPVALRPDERWRTDQPLRPRLVTTAIAAPLLRRYGYSTFGGRTLET